MKAAIDKKIGEKAFILGPCSAESEEQLLQLGKELQPLHPDLVRAGLWKPRTRPGHFQGYGELAIPWMQSLKEQFGFKICTEVATSQHVEIALKAGFDALWIGARTTVNPFYVEDIAQALKGVDIPVLVKNPMNPDLFLWLGAIERLLHVGIQRIAAIHRGFSFYGNSIYRNVPRWQIPIELSRRIPGLQILVDISHISGNTKHLREIAQIAMDLNFDGLMVELHAHPELALSDADQQITPAFFKKEILDKLILRHLQTDNEVFNRRIEEFRLKIDGIDAQILHLLAERMRWVDAIGMEKRANEISIFQPERWDQIVRRLSEIAQKEGLTEEFIFSLIEAIHIESIHHQSQRMNE